MGQRNQRFLLEKKVKEGFTGEAGIGVEVDGGGDEGQLMELRQ